MTNDWSGGKDIHKNTIYTYPDYIYVDSLIGNSADPKRVIFFSEKIYKL